MAQIWDEADDLQGSRLLVMLALADWANDGGYCWPSSEALAQKARMSRATVFRVLADLEQAGYVERQVRPGHSTMYRVVPRPTRQGCQPDTPPDDETGGSHSETGLTGETGRGLTGETGGVSPVRHRTTREPPEEPSPFAPPDGNADEGGQLTLLPGSRQPATSTVRRRQRDHLWEAVMDACGVDAAAIPRAARGAYNRAVKDLRDVGATPEQIRDRAAVFRLTWPGASLTPTALARRWSEVSRLQPRPATTDQRVAAGMAMRDHFAAMDRRDAR